MTQSKTKKPAAKQTKAATAAKKVAAAKPNAFMNSIRVRITLVEPLLGTQSNNPEVQREHVSKNAPDAPTLEEEVAATSVDEVVEGMMTVFPRVNGFPVNWDYQWKGYMKSCAGFLARVKDTQSSTLTAFRKVIAGTVFVTPRAIPFVLPDPLPECVFPINYAEESNIGRLERPLRAETAQGPRIALANSEVLPPGSTAEFTIMYPKLKAKGVDLELCIREWLDYGVYHGHGQWRNGGFGRFTWEEIHPIIDDLTK